MKKTLFEICFGHEKLVWHFAVNPDGHLCFRCSPKDRKRWSDPVVLQKDYGGQFAAVLVAGEQLHLASTDKENTIWYHHHQKGVWHSTLVKNVLPWPEINSLRLSIDSHGRVHILYCLQRKAETNKWQIVHQFKKDGSWASFVLEEGTGTGEAATSAAIDDKDNLHVVASVPKEESSTLKHFIFSVSEARWKWKDEIPSQPFENRYPCMVFDSKGNLHLVWAGSDGRNLRTMYNRLGKGPWPEGGWGKPRYISAKDCNSYSPYIFSSGENLIVLWQQVDGVLYRKSTDMGEIWQEIQQYQEVNNFEDHTLQYFSMEDKDQEALSIFNFSAPQVALVAAATLLNEVEPEGDSKALALPVRISNKEMMVPLESRISKNAKRFLLGYSDTRLSNRLMNQTIDAKEKEIRELLDVNKTLGEKIHHQVRQVNIANSLAEMYRKEAVEYKQINLRLKNALVDTKDKIKKLLEEKAVLETTVKSLESEKHRLQKDVHRLEYEKSNLVHRMSIFEAEKKNLHLNLKEAQQRESTLKNSLTRLQEEILKLEAGNKALQQELVVLKSFPAASAIEQEKTARTSPPNQITGTLENI